MSAATAAAGEVASLLKVLARLPQTYAGLALGVLYRAVSELVAGGAQ